MELVLFRTPTEWVALALVLIAGWLWGLASAPGTRKWRNRLADAEVEAAGYREQAEAELRAARARIAELEATSTGAPADDGRIAALEAENARLNRYLRAPQPAAPAPSPAAPVYGAAGALVAPAAAEPPEPIAPPAPVVPAVAQTPPPAPVQQESKGWLHAMEAGLAGAVVGAVADRIADRADGKQDHGVLHNLGAAASGAAVGVLTEKLAERHAAHEVAEHLETENGQGSQG